MPKVNSNQDSASKIVSRDDDSDAKNVTHLESSRVALLTLTSPPACESRFTGHNVTVTWGIG